jgi:hypothetical protein
MILAGVVLTGCSSTPTFQTGEDAELSFDGLTRMDGTIMDIVWARPDIDLTGYRKIMLEGMGVEYREVSGPYSGRAGMGSSRIQSGNQTEFQLDEATRALFEEEIGSAFIEAMGSSNVFEIVEEAGPDVLLVRGGLLDVVSRVPPDSVGRTEVFIDSVGEATLILEIRSSVSKSIYVRAVDGRAMSQSFQMQRSNRASNRAEVRRLGRRWGDMLRDGLDTLLTDGVKQ